MSTLLPLPRGRPSPILSTARTPRASSGPLWAFPTLPCPPGLRAARISILRSGLISPSLMALFVPTVPKKCLSASYTAPQNCRLRSRQPTRHPHRVSAECPQCHMSKSEPQDFSPVLISGNDSCISLGPHTHSHTQSPPVLCLTFRTDWEPSSLPHLLCLCRTLPPSLHSRWGQWLQSTSLWPSQPE